MGRRAGWVTVLPSVLPEDSGGIRRTRGRFRHGSFRRPCQVWDGTPEPRCPGIHQEGVPFALGWGWGRKRRRLQQGEAHFATVSPGVLQATRGVATKSPFPTTMEPSRARRRYLSDSPYRWGRPDQWICGEDECSSLS